MNGLLDALGMAVVFGLPIGIFVFADELGAILLALASVVAAVADRIRGGE